MVEERYTLLTRHSSGAENTQTHPFAFSLSRRRRGWRFWAYPYCSGASLVASTFQAQGRTDEPSSLFTTTAAPLTFSHDRTSTPHE